MCVYVYVYILDNAYPIVLLTLNNTSGFLGMEDAKSSREHRHTNPQVKFTYVFLKFIIYNTYIIYYLCTYGIRIQMDRAAKKAGRETNHPFMDLVC